jgi:hypothetical protein
MSQLVRNKLSARGAVRPELPIPENHVLADCVSEGAYSSRGLSRRGIRVHSHIAEVVLEARLHESAHR